MIAILEIKFIFSVEMVFQNKYARNTRKKEQAVKMSLKSFEKKIQNAVQHIRPVLLFRNGRRHSKPTLAGIT